MASHSWESPGESGEPAARRARHSWEAEAVDLPPLVAGEPEPDDEETPWGVYDEDDDDSVGDVQEPQPAATPGIIS